MKMTEAQIKFWDNFEKKKEDKSMELMKDNFRPYVGDYSVYSNDRWITDRLYKHLSLLDKNFKPTKI